MISSFFFRLNRSLFIAGERLQLYTFIRHSWQLRTNGSLVCLIDMYWDTRHPFIWSTRDTHTRCWAFRRKKVTTSLNDLCLSRRGIKPRSPVCEANDLQTQPQRQYGVNKIHDNWKNHYEMTLYIFESVLIFVKMYWFKNSNFYWIRN